MHARYDAIRLIILSIYASIGIHRMRTTTIGVVRSINNCSSTTCKLVRFKYTVRIMYYANINTFYLISHDQKKKKKP